MTDQPKSRVRKDVHIGQCDRGVTIYVYRWSDGDLIGAHSYEAWPFEPHPRSSGFIARRIKRGIRLLSASIQREWEAQ
jgi:hypothetical protein